MLELPDAALDAGGGPVERGGALQQRAVQTAGQDAAEVLVLMHRVHRRGRLADEGIAATDDVVVDDAKQLRRAGMFGNGENPRLEIAGGNPRANPCGRRGSGAHSLRSSSLPAQDRPVRWPGRRRRRQESPAQKSPDATTEPVIATAMALGSAL